MPNRFFRRGKLTVLDALLLLALCGALILLWDKSLRLEHAQQLIDETTPYCPRLLENVTAA